MKKTIKLPIAEILAIDFKSDWGISPTLSVSLDQKSFEDVVITADGLYGEINYDVFDLVEHTYSYISPITGKVETHTQSAGTFGRPVFYNEITMTEVTQEEVDVLIAAYEDYLVDTAYSKGDRFKYEGKVYDVLQSHTSQEDWKPDVVKSLYRNIVPEEIIADFVQPTGAHDVYHIGDKVLFEGKTYESVINDNSWSPTVYPAGWKLI